ncbi:SufS family cysteine desulfurase [Saccharophagus sp. K07]|uniref:aminotransferase class V-fold PLP-dependent enzyme n=1 Tax=Saccharophagus sp. K07 TaxID=2283636 RepID=UPI001652817A|nr:SufS family cysteine desulfurase [Saccharophagus sp. K07]MBC6905720.1 SufS family cysteine desulfurase [Saccharophagus sp. K07]
MTSYDVEAVRRDFPILQQLVHDQPLVYLDSAATTQKPRVVIDALSQYYLQDNSNVHRAAHALADRATTGFENARKRIAQFINSPKPEQIIWTRGTTESINLVAASYGRVALQPGDKILVSTLEHHSNIVPWQLIAAERGATVIPIPLDNRGDLDLDAYAALLDERVKIVAVNQVSNALGTVNPIKSIVQSAHAVGAKVLVDGAQAIAHFPVDVQDLNCDFYAFSGHKAFGPTGIGVLWGRESLLEQMPPYQGGGEMIESVSFSGTTFNQLPYKFEAGTPDIAGAIGMAAAIEYLGNLDRAAVQAHEAALLAECIERGEEMGLRRVASPRHAAGIYSFLLPGAHPSDVGTILDQQGVAVRTGHHCAQPLMAYLGVPGTVRASLSIYNNHEDIDRFFNAMAKVKKFLL